LPDFFFAQYALSFADNFTLVAAVNVFFFGLAADLTNAFQV